MERENRCVPFRVYGLERSGTNLMEWIVREHFNPNYERIDVIGNNILMRKYREKQSLKHTLPTCINDKNIVMYKPFEQWVESWNKYYKRGDNYILGGDVGCSKEVYDMYLNTAIEYNLKPNDLSFLLINYNDLMDNYESVIKRIAEYLEYDLKEIKPMPTKWMGTNMKPIE